MGGASVLDLVVGAGQRRSRRSRHDRPELEVWTDTAWSIL